MRDQVPPRACARGSQTELHMAAASGDFERVRSLLSERRSHHAVNRGDSKGQTPLMLAAANGQALICLFLIGKGANPSMASVDGTPLLVACQYGYLDVVKVLLAAGAYLEATTSTLSSTPLHLAAQMGHSEVARELISAGANVNCRRSDGATPLVSAATKGHVQIIRHLLRAKADPVLAMADPSNSFAYTPLEVGAQHDQPGVVRELIEEVGIGRCGGPTGGSHALALAAQEEGLESMALLAGAGVVDTGRVLHNSIEYGREKAVKFLLQRWGGTTSGTDRYVDVRDRWGSSPLIKSVSGDVDTLVARPRIVRLLLDAGADTSTAVRITSIRGDVIFDDTPLNLATRMLLEKRMKGTAASERQLRRLEAVRRLLLQVQAIHAESWAWPSGAPVACKGFASEGASSPPGTLKATLSVLRRRARRPGVVLASLFRYPGNR